MANRFPLILDAEAQRIKELASGDNLNLAGNGISAVRDIIPETNETYDLGSAEKRWRDLFLSGQSIHLGGGVITYDSTTSRFVFTDDSGIPSPANLDVSDLVVNGNLTVNGNTTSISTTTLAIEDKNIELAVVDTPTDTTADGGGITIKGATDKTFNWVNSTASWTSSENLELSSNKVFRINNNQVLSETALGSSVVNSSLTSVGIIGSGTWEGSVVSPTYGGTGINNGTKTITLGGNFTHSGEHTLELATTANTSVSLPSSGTIATTSNVETLTNKTISGATNTLTDIGNSSLVNSSVTVNGAQVSLGSSTSFGTDSVNEGTTNLYFTQTRTRESISVSDVSGDGSLSYDNSTGVITYTGPSASEIRSHLSSTTSTGVTYNSTTGVIELASIPNNSLSNSSVTVGTTSISLGASSTILGGLTSVTSDSFVGELTGNASTATKLATARTISISGDVTGSTTFDGSGNANIVATIEPNSVALGTDTTGDYVASMTAGAGITVGTASGEGSTPVITNTGVLSIVAGNAITVSGATGEVTVNHADTSSAANISSDNSAGVVLQDVSLTFDTYGHVTGATVGTVDLDNRYYTKTETDSGFVNASGDSMTGFLTLHADPTQALHAATKEYVDSVAAGLKAAPAVEVATTSNLSATYDNGTLGVGATLTSTTNGPFPEIDGITLSSTALGLNGVLVKNQSTSAHNGRYNLTQVGDDNTPWILTRCGVCNQSNEIPGSYVFVKGGTTLGGTGWTAYVADPSTYTVGTDNIIYFQFSGAGTYTAGSGLTLVGTQFAHEDTSSVANVSSDNSGNTFIQDISLTFDTFGHVTGASVATGTVTVGDGTLTVDTLGTGLSGSGTFSANQSGNTTITITSNATDANTINTIVARDASGNFTAGTITAALSGNASTATALQTARNINGTSFDGTQNITTANWGTARTLSFVGDASGSSSVNGSANVETTLTLANTGVTAGTYGSSTEIPVLTFDAKGRVTAASTSNITVGDGTLTLNTSGIATGSQTFTANQGTNATFTVNVPGTNIAEGTRTTTTVPITSSTGTGATLSAATTSLAGVMTSADKTKLDGIAAGAQVNVATNIAEGTRTTTTVPITSSTGTGATLSAATTSLAGVMTSADKTKLDGIAAGAQVNVATNLGYTTAASTGSVTSSTGTGATIPAATTSLAGLLTSADKTKLDGIAAGAIAGISVIDDTTTNATRYLTFTSATSGSISSSNISSTKLQFNPSTGDLSATNVNSLSDINKKEDIETIVNAIELLMHLRGVFFRWKDSGIKGMGVIAQEIEQVLPEVVTTLEDGTKTVSYGNVIGLLIEVTKSHEERIRKLEQIVFDK